MKTKLLALALLLALWPLQGAAAAEPAVLINEVAWMGTAVSANDEWLELYNQTEQEIDLAGWKLEAADGSPKIELAGIIPAGGYFLLERTDDETVPDLAANQIYTGSLSNSGEWLKLSDSSGNLIDEINAVAGWPGGDNDAKKTLERVNSDSWQTGLEPGGTPKAKNNVPNDPLPDDPEELPETSDTGDPAALADQSESAAKRGDIIFNEVFPDPVGSDLEQEFIEIKNAGAKKIDLTGWKITSLAKQIFILPSLMMMPQSLAVFYRPQTNLALNNLKEKITLYAKTGKIIDQTSYAFAPEGQSYQINDLAELSFGEISPFKPNLAKGEILPLARISGPKLAQVGEIIDFDASDSFDSQNRPLEFFWDFGDGRTGQGVIARQIYIKSGTYEIALKAVASELASSTEILKIKIAGKEMKKETSAATTTPTTTAAILPAAAGLGGPAITETADSKPTAIEENLPYIYISEFLPSPDTKNSQEEFVEIFSQETWPTDLSGFLLDDAEGGSKPFVIPAGTIIKPGQYLAFFKPQTKLALNDSGDSIRLLSPGGRIVDQVDYAKTKKGAAFALAADFSWQEVDAPTPGRPNGLPGLEAETESEEPAVAATFTPKILGAEISRPIEAAPAPKESPAQGQPTGKLRYFVSAIFATAALGIGAVVKLRKPA